MLCPDISVIRVLVLSDHPEKSVLGGLDMGERPDILALRVVWLSNPECSTDKSVLRGLQLGVHPGISASRVQRVKTIP